MYQELKSDKRSIIDKIIAFIIGVICLFVILPWLIGLIVGDTSTTTQYDMYDTGPQHGEWP